MEPRDIPGGGDGIQESDNAPAFPFWCTAREASAGVSPAPLPITSLRLFPGEHRLVTKACLPVVAQ